MSAQGEARAGVPFVLLDVGVLHAQLGESSPRWWESLSWGLPSLLSFHSLLPGCFPEALVFVLTFLQ